MDSKIYDQASSLWKSVAKSEIKGEFDLEKQLEIQSKLLSVFQVGKYYYYIFNIKNSEFDFISNEIVDVLGYKSEEFDLAKYLEILHPEDHSLVLNTESEIIKFLNSIELSNIYNYKVQYDYRLKNIQGEYIRILHQSIIIQADDNRNLFRSFGLDTDITHIKPHGKSTLSFFGLGGLPSYINVDVTKVYPNPFDLFTTRESEILKSIVEGKTSEQIANEYILSIHTINTHRKNLFAKAHVSSLTELVSKAIYEGWV